MTQTESYLIKCEKEKKTDSEIERCCRGEKCEESEREREAVSVTCSVYRERWRP